MSHQHANHEAVDIRIRHTQNGWCYAINDYWGQLIEAGKGFKTYTDMNRSIELTLAYREPPSAA